MVHIFTHIFTHFAKWPRRPRSMTVVNAISSEPLVWLHPHLKRSFSMYLWWSLKEWFNCKMRMPRTVKCRPTVAYWVQIDAINIPTELITRYHSNKTLIQCCINVRPTSATLAQHWTSIGWMYNVWEKVLLPSKHKIFVWHLYNVGPTSSTLVQHCIKSYKCFALTVRQFPHTRSNTVSLFASHRPSRGKGKGLWIFNS